MPSHQQTSVLMIERDSRTLSLMTRFSKLCVLPEKCFAGGLFSSMKSPIFSDVLLLSFLIQEKLIRELILTTSTLILDWQFPANSLQVPSDLKCTCVLTAGCDPIVV